jgi:hypothetical protein
MADIERDERAPALATPEWKAGLNGTGTAWKLGLRGTAKGVKFRKAWKLGLRGTAKGVKFGTAWNL